MQAIIRARDRVVKSREAGVEMKFSLDIYSGGVYPTNSGWQATIQVHRQFPARVLANYEIGKAIRLPASLTKEEATHRRDM